MWPLKGNMCMKIPFNLPSHLKKRVLKGFWVNPKWLPNHVTYGVIGGKLFLLHGQAVMPVMFLLDLFSRFGEDFGRFLFLFIYFLKYGCWTIWLASFFYFFLLTNLSRDDPQKCAYWSDVAFYECNYDVIMKAPMTSLKKVKLISHREYLTGAKFQFLPWSGFGDRGPKFFLFSNKAATLCDLWHNYH